VRTVVRPILNTVKPLLHVDADAFFASVAEREDPWLVGRPAAVGVAGFVVASANYPARDRGVRSAMPVRDAQRICPELVVVELPEPLIQAASAELFGVLHDVADVVEPGSMEEAFLDVPGLTWAEARDFAGALQRRIRHEVRLGVSIGIGRTKLMAKLASRAAKPAGVHVIDPEAERDLRPGLKVADLWGVGPRTLEKLAGIETVADLVACGEAGLVARAGTTMGRRLHAIATGTDDATVRTPGPKKSISAQRNLNRDPGGDEHSTVLQLADRIASRLQEAGLAARRIGLDDADPATERSIVTEHPVHGFDEISVLALELLTERDGARPRSLRLHATRLEPAPRPSPAAPLHAETGGS
jgi:DNA polymerase-4